MLHTAMQRADLQPLQLSLLPLMPYQVAETDDSPETCFWAKQDLQRVINEERQWRCKLWSTGRQPSSKCMLMCLPDNKDKLPFC